MSERTICWSCGDELWTPASIGVIAAAAAAAECYRLPLGKWHVTRDTYLQLVAMTPYSSPATDAAPGLRVAGLESCERPAEGPVHPYPYWWEALNAANRYAREFKDQLARPVTDDDVRRAVLGGPARPRPQPPAGPGAGGGRGEGSGADEAPGGGA